MLDFYRAAVVPEELYRAAVVPEELIGISSVYRKQAHNLGELQRYTSTKIQKPQNTKCYGIATR